MRRRITSLVALLLLSAALLQSHPVQAAGSITGVLPSNGPAAGGNAITILGNGFTMASVVYFGGVPSPSVSYLDSTILNAQVPAGNGTVMVTVVNSDGSTSAGYPYTYNGTSSTTTTGLTISSISPNVAASTGLTPVTIYGTGFTTPASVTFGGASAIAANVISATQIAATAPAGSVGNAPVVVTSGGQSVVFSGFSYGTTTSTTSSGSISVSSVSPSSVPAGGGITVQINGTGFASGATVSFGGYFANNPIVYSSGLISVITPAGPSGSVPMVVTNPTGESAVYQNFLYGAGSTTTTVTTTPGQPSVQSISPNTGSSAGGTPITITGAGFSQPTTVTFGNVPATNVTVVNSSTITATTPPNAVGAVTVLVSGAGSQVGGLVSGFTYQVAVPLVSSITPAAGLPQGGTPLTITGSGFVPGATVTVGGLTATGTTVVSPTQISTTTPPGPAGSAIVLVINPGGAISGLANAYSYSTTAALAPSLSVTSVTPATGPTTGGTTVSIAGTGFLPGATVTIGGTIATASVTNATQIVATTPPTATTGPVAVTVSNPGSGSATLQSGFSYTGGSASAPSSAPSTSGPLVPTGGSGLFVFKGGSNADLVAASGCNASTAVFWVTDSKGAWIGYLPSVPVAIVNAAWNSLFPNGIPANTAIFARCS